VILALLAAVLVMVDRVSAKVAANHIHDKVIAELASRGVTTDTMQVTVEGFPFLTQFARGRYDKIKIDLQGVRAEGARLPYLLVVAEGVHANASQVVQGDAQVTAEKVTGDGIIDWASLGTLVDQAGVGFTDVTFAPVNDQLGATGTVSVLGQSIAVSATAAVSLSGDTVKIKLSDARLQEVNLPQAVQTAVDDYLRNFTFSVKIPPLPFHLNIDQMHLEPTGLSITATATNVALA
jgi:hypothetical protein